MGEQRKERYQSRRMQENRADKGMPKEERIRRKRRRRRKKKLMRALICALMAAVLILLIVLLFMLGRFLKKGMEESNFTLPWNKGEAVIMLDAGHGGTDQGTSYEDILEKDLNLKITQKVEKLLKEAGYQVLMTRSGDATMDKYERAKFANRKKPDFFVSIHCNFLEEGQADGIETYYAESKAADSQALAEEIQSSLIEQTGAKDRGARTEDYVVVKNTDMPAALVEVGFLSDETERELLQDEDYQDKLAKGIAEGIRSYWKEREAQEKENE